MTQLDLRRGARGVLGQLVIQCVFSVVLTNSLVFYATWTNKMHAALAVPNDYPCNNRTIFSLLSSLSYLHMCFVRSTGFCPLFEPLKACVRVLPLKMPALRHCATSRGGASPFQFNCDFDHMFVVVGSPRFYFHPSSYLVFQNLPRVQQVVNLYCVISENILWSFSASFVRKLPGVPCRTGESLWSYCCALPLLLFLPMPNARFYPTFGGALVCASKAGGHGAARHGLSFAYSYQSPGYESPQVAQAIEVDEEVCAGLQRRTVASHYAESPAVSEG